MAACSEPELFELEASTATLTISVDLDIEHPIHSKDAVKYSGEASITNLTDIAQPYSNQWLLLEDLEGTRTRAFLDSIASHAVYIGTMDIPPNETTTLSVYWVIPKSENGAVGLTEESLKIDPNHQ